MACIHSVAILRDDINRVSHEAQKTDTLCTYAHLLHTHVYTHEGTTEYKHINCNRRENRERNWQRNVQRQCVDSEASWITGPFNFNILITEASASESSSPVPPQKA